MAEAVLRAQGQCSAERIQSIAGIRAGYQIHARDRAFLDENPIDRVAEWIVDAHTVLIHRDALRLAEQRGSNESAELNIRLQWIALCLVDEDAAEVCIEE